MLNNIEGGKTPILSLEECHAMGFLSVGYVLSGVFAAARALERTFNHIVAEVRVAMVCDGDYGLGSCALGSPRLFCF